MTVRLQKCVPNLGVANAAAAVEYYRDKLGFSLDWDDAVVGQDHMMYASLSRDDCQICVSEHPGDRGMGSVWCYVNDVRALYKELKAADALVDGEPEEMPWAETELKVRDPDGNRICFTQPAPRKEEG